MPHLVVNALQVRLHQLDLVLVVNARPEPGHLQDLVVVITV